MERVLWMRQNTGIRHAKATVVIWNCALVISLSLENRSSMCITMNFAAG